jgi:hypothetical protein
MMGVPRESLSHDEVALQDFIRGEMCRNHVLTEYLNGRGNGKTCVQGGGMLCDVCSGKTRYGDLKRKLASMMEEREQENKRRKAYERQAQLRENRVKINENYWDRLEFIMEEIGRGCTICWFRDGDFKSHGLNRCRAWEVLFPTMSVGQWRVKYLDLSSVRNSCWSCGLPGDKCEMYSKERRRCGRQDFIIPTVIYFASRKDLEYYSIVRKALGREIVDLTELSRELVKRARVLEENGTMAFKVWVELLRMKDGDLVD